jgi:hypothetical protein
VAADCTAVFCAMHWHRSNHRCPQHGYVEVSGVEYPVPDRQHGWNTAMKQMNQADVQGALAATGRALCAALGKMKTLGAGAVEHVQKFRQARSPEGMIESLDGSLNTLAERRGLVLQRLETLHTDILSKKSGYATASKARQRALKRELRNLLTAHKAAEREHEVLLNNERAITVVKGRLQELTAMKIPGVSEPLIDKLIDDIEDAVDEAEGVADATSALENAGGHRTTEVDAGTLWDALADLDETEEAPSPETTVQAAVPEPGIRSQDRQTDNVIE